MYSRRSLENLALVVVGLTLTGALMRMLSGGSDTLDGDPRAQVCLALCYLAVFVIAVAHARWTAWVVRRNPAIVALLAVTFLSALWAEMPDLVVRRAIAVAGTTLFGLVVAIRLTFPEQLKLFRWATRAAAAMCLGVLILSPARHFRLGLRAALFVAYSITRIIWVRPWPSAF